MKRKRKRKRKQKRTLKFQETATSSDGGQELCQRLEEAFPLDKADADLDDNRALQIKLLKDMVSEQLRIESSIKAKTWPAQWSTVKRYKLGLFYCKLAINKRLPFRENAAGPNPVAFYANRIVNAARQFLQKKHADLDIPEMMICPLSKDLFKDPVIAMDGYTYERSEIIRYFSTVTTGSQ